VMYQFKTGIDRALLLNSYIDVLSIVVLHVTTLQ
jgi:hypothetical protein